MVIQPYMFEPHSNTQEEDKEEELIIQAHNEASEWYKHIMRHQKDTLFTVDDFPLFSTLEMNRESYLD